IIIMIVTKLFTKFINSSVVKGVMYGMRPAVVGLILSAVVTILLQLILPNVNLSQLGTSSFDGFDGMSALLFVAFFALYHIKIKGKTIHPVLLIIFSAVVGIVVFGVFKL
ncbi:MAG: chromate transporter, partial [Clostridia bacterium]